MAFALDNIGSEHNAFNAIHIHLVSACNSTITLSVTVSMENEWGRNGSVTTGSIGCRSLGKFAGLSHGMTNTCYLPQLQIIINTLTGEQ